MNRELFFNLLNNIYSNTVSHEEIQLLFTEYCLEFNKSKEDIDIFLHYITLLDLTNSIITFPIDYYMKKYNIIVLYNKQKQIIKIY